jgi:hypothetical protein
MPPSTGTGIRKLGKNRVVPRSVGGNKDKITTIKNNARHLFIPITLLLTSFKTAELSDFEMPVSGS